MGTRCVFQLVKGAEIVQYCKALHNIVKHCAALYNTVQCWTALCSAVQPGGIGYHASSHQKPARKNSHKPANARKGGTGYHASSHHISARGALDTMPRLISNMNE